MADLEENARRQAAGKKTITHSPIAIQVVRRIDALLDIERFIKRRTAEERRAVRQELSKPLVAELQVYLREQRAKLSRADDLANNAAERGLRGTAFGQKSWMFCGSDRGAQRAAAMYNLIVTAKMNGINPQARLADILARIAVHLARRLDELLPWNWMLAASATASVAA